MKNKKDWLAVLGIGILLFATCVVPNLLTWVEDERIQTESKKYEIKEVKLNTGRTNMEEKLSGIQNVLIKDVVVQKATADLNVEQKVLQKKAREYLLLISGEEAPEFLRFSAVSLVMADTDKGNVCPLWKCVAIDEQEEVYSFWMDEETEKVIAFEIPFLEPWELIEEQTVPDKMAKYYGFSSGEWKTKFSKYSKTDYIRMDFFLLDEANEKELPLSFYGNRDRLSFNAYPGQNMAYDSN